MLIQIQLIWLVLISFKAVNINSSSQGNVVQKWADTIGKDLWDLGGRITKFSEIELRYHHLNAQVEDKNPRDLLDDIIEVLTRMMDRKMDAVQCIVHEAESKSELFDYDNNTIHHYYNSKYSNISGEEGKEHDLKVLNDNAKRYKELILDSDTHFYNLKVNTSHSSVHVPTQVFDLHKDPSIAIQWSEELDKVFIQNYQSDPSLTWQYFGSNSGIMRHYPAKDWPTDYTDLFDCRIRTWFIEAATCTKDIVILLDNSGSMDAMGKHIGVLTASTILDTLSNNDYFNVLNYTDRKVNYTVECSKNVLLQATKENINVFKDRLKKLKPTNKTDIAVGLEEAFELLANYREKKGCDGIHGHCNQAIMIITDGLSKNFSNIVEKYDFLHDGRYKPVRIFSYLVGQEVTNEEDIMWMSCHTKGYYIHVQAIEQVTSAVLEYINVIARPLILQEDDHPVSWTHVYMDDTYNDDLDMTINEPYRMLTSAAAPAFDKKRNRGGDNTTRVASLLGVAATDVPIEDIARLTLPYMIGVSGYAFIVSNNGYVLMHPDLRPMVGNYKMKNFNSIDLTEVEQFYNNSIKNKRENTPKLLKLRSYLINGTKGSLRNIPIKYHYDGLRRIAVETYDYYFAPLYSTPFTLALAIPKSHGYQFLRVGDEIVRNRHTGIKLENFFKGENWKIHPKWVYCKYHYLEGHEFDNAESEILHFLSKMYNQNFKWRKQYEASNKSGVENLGQIECGRKSLKANDYYCDKQLIQRLIFDAKNTQPSFDEPWAFQESEKNLFDRYAVKLRFVATMSGLTRWEYKNVSAINDAKQFGELHSRAIDEMWYKSAVLQHQYDKAAFVYAIEDYEDDDKKNVIIGSYAIFPKDNGKEAPGSVVGFQFGREELNQKFKEITTKPSNDCPQCSTCDTLTCYIVDHSGYILVGNEEHPQDNFFGEIEGDVMETMLEEKIFEEVTVYDYQALCDIRKVTTKTSAASGLREEGKQPFLFITKGIKWLVREGIKFVVQLNQEFVIDPVYSYFQNQTIPEDVDDEKEAKVENNYFSCDNEIKLYVLKQHLLKSNEFTGEFKAKFQDKTLIRREFYVRPIPNSNLILVAINNTFGKGSDVIYTPSPQFSKSDGGAPCYKIYLGTLPRGPPRGCYFKNDLENEIKACGRGSTIYLQTPTILLYTSMLIGIRFVIS